MKCKYCVSEMVEIPDFEGADSYGDFHHKCSVCGAIGYEIFGHGISWEEGSVKEVNGENSNQENQCDATKMCIYRFSDKCDRCVHNRGKKDENNCFVPI